MSKAAKEYKHFGTAVIHAAQEPNPVHGAVMPSLELATTYAQSSPGVHRGFEYSRTGNPTRKVLEELLAAVEKGKYGSCFSSGCAATAAIMQALVTKGETIVSIDDVYGGTNRYFQKVGELMNGVKPIFLDLTESPDGKNYANLRKTLSNPKVKLLWLETPTNPTLKVVDIRALCEIARQCNVVSVVDNTFATPFNQQPLTLGADIVVHSLTKYMNGHSDVVGGCVVTNNQDLDTKIKFVQNTIGSVPAPFDCYQVIRGMKTLNIRMERHCSNALTIAKYLENHPNVERVFYPGLPSHPNYELAKRQMKTGGGMITFLLKGGLKESQQFLESVKLMICAESLGAVETLVEHPAIMTHASVPPDQRRVLGISDNLVRLSVGIEDVRDIMSDLEMALGSIGKARSRL